MPICDDCDKICKDHGVCMLRITALEERSIDNSDTISAIKQSLSDINQTLGQVRVAVICFLLFLTMNQFGVIAMLGKAFGGK